MKTLLISFFVLFFAPSAAQANTSGLPEENSYITAGISRARALAMGGAYHSLVDDRPPSLYLQIGAFAERSNAERLISRLASDAPRGVHR